MTDRVSVVIDRLMPKVEAMLYRFDGVRGFVTVGYTQQTAHIWWSDLRVDGALQPPITYVWTGEMDEDGRRIYRERR